MSGKTLLSIRMRASKKIADTTEHKAGSDEMHISGAEGLYNRRQIDGVISAYIKRAFHHPRGTPDRVVLTIEEISVVTTQIRALPVTTIECASPSDARSFIKKMLKKSGVSGPASRAALGLLYSSSSMRGASLIYSGRGKRAEPDSKRGVRVSRAGITGRAERSLNLELKKHGLANETVREALIIASKVASCGAVVAEVCISDDPDYTTGYFSSRETGYVRIPNIKPKDSSYGGRVFFIEDNSEIAPLIDYLEKAPVIVNSVSLCLGTTTPDEIIDHHRL
ncbi:MAG: 6-carboxyhexanoate--CoA ligase [Nitrospirae bacterium]|nr:6-carboxyhexanoate--CoA ligase [Nitrospirota bacterium]